MIFCGAPPHFTGVFGFVKIARPSLHLAEEPPGAVDGLVAVVAAHAVVPERGRQPLDPGPVELDAGRHDEVVVVNADGRQTSCTTLCSGSNSGRASRIHTAPGGISPASGRRVDSFVAAPPPTSVHSGW
jgi:hypothetical protein